MVIQQDELKAEVETKTSTGTLGEGCIVKYENPEHYSKWASNYVHREAHMFAKSPQIAHTHCDESKVLM